jgi:glutathione peroxidase
MMMSTALMCAMLLAAAAPGAAEVPMSFFDLTASTIDGKSESLGKYKGKALLVVNTASECGYTPQYAGLQKLWETYKDRGAVVLAFPSNDFGGQEPGSAAEIKKFCETRYKVTFPIYEKVKTKGDGQSPVYAFLTAKHAAPKWNFHKYVVGKDGQVKAAFSSSVAPDSEELRKAIEAALER